MGKQWQARASVAGLHWLQRLNAPAVASPNSSGKRYDRSGPALSAKTRTSLVLQGRYMGYMRQLKPRQKAQVRKIKEAKGVRGAIQRARELSQV